MGKRRCLDLTPRQHIVRVGFQIREPSVNLCFLSIRRGWECTAFANVVPEPLHQFKLLLNTEVPRLVKKLSFHQKSIARFEV